jgi:hypothetical protein
MKTKIMFILILMFSLVVAMGWATTQNKGAEQMELFGGVRGKVPFPHAVHQEKLGDCNACHSLFSQTSGAIEKLKKEEKLKKKQVMNKLCIKCHKSEKKAGHSSGPTTCSKCHVK